MMTPEEQTFNSWKYSRRISLVAVGNGLFGIAGPDLRLQDVGELEDLIPKIKEMAYRLAVNPHCVQHKPVEELSLDYLTEIDL